MRQFFEHQDRARRSTRVLLLLMGLSIAAMAGAIYLVLEWVARYTWLPRGHGHPVLSWLFGIANAPFALRPMLLLGTLAGTAALVVIASGSRMLALRGGGTQIAEMMGGRLVSGSPRDALEKRLLNVVEEMAIASGVPVPQVFVLPGESGINAFAAGLSLNDAAITVTRGCLEKLTRDELQGVIAHEFSHVLNGDMRLNIRLMGIVFGIVCIGLFGRLLMRVGRDVDFADSDRDRKSPGVPLFMLGLAVLVIGSIGECLGKLIKAAVSRQREYLADASAVQFTRNPRGISGALQKIGGFASGGRVSGSRAEEASHFFFADIHHHALAAPWFATHPPLAERIARIDPEFSGTFPKVAPGIAQPEPEDSVTRGFAPVTPLNTEIVAHVGAPSVASVACAQELIGTLPADLKRLVLAPFSASAAVYALLLSDVDATRLAQRRCIESTLGPAAWLETQRLEQRIRVLPRRERLPLVELLAPALRALSRDQRANFSHVVSALIDADQAVSIFEYVLSHILADRMSDPRNSGRSSARHRSLRSVEAELRLLLSLLAHAGAFQAGDAGPAFALGVSRLVGIELELLPQSRRLLSGLSDALDQLRGLVPELTEQVVDACAHVVIADQRVHEDEFTLLRAVCAALHCPLPPFSGLTPSQPPRIDDMEAR